jgi:peroxiredoxin
MRSKWITFVIGADGKIRSVFHAVKPAKHDELILNALRG